MKTVKCERLVKLRSVNAKIGSVLNLLSVRNYVANPEMRRARARFKVGEMHTLSSIECPKTWRGSLCVYNDPQKC